jgi:hypothetical protein
MSNAVDELNPSLTVNDLKHVLDHASFQLSCASLKRFSKFEKDVLCSKNANFKEKCAHYCSGAMAVPDFVLNGNATVDDDGVVATAPLMRNLQGSYMLKPEDRLKTIAYADVTELEECKRRCVDDNGCACNLVTFNTDTKECTLDCPTERALKESEQSSRFQFIPSPSGAPSDMSFEKVRR